MDKYRKGISVSKGVDAGHGGAVGAMLAAFFVPFFEGRLTDGQSIALTGLLAFLYVALAKAVQNFSSQSGKRRY